MSSAEVRALVVEDDPSWQGILSELLTDAGLSVDIAHDLKSAERLVRQTAHRLAVVDLSLGGADHHNQDGLVVLDSIRKRDPGCVAVLLTGFATVELAVGAITRFGALTCLRKEVFSRAEFRQIVRQALAMPPPRSSGGQPLSTERQPRQTTKQPSSRPRWRVLIVEDDAGWRAVLDDMLQDMHCQTRLAASYAEALGLLRRLHFDLAVVDLALNAMNVSSAELEGNRVLAAARQADVPTIVVSGAASPIDLERAYRDYGVLACLEKQSFDRALFRRTVADALSAALPGEELASLTRREREVLDLLAQGLTNREIASRLVISINTVKRHLRAIFAKLQVSTRAAAAARAVGGERRLFDDRPDLSP